jgi:hypothetical protein
MLLPGGSSKKDELQGLGSSEEIALFVQQQAALVVKAQKEEAQQRVRHLRLDLVQHIILLVLWVAIGIALAIGTLSNPELLKVALGGGGAWAVAGGFYRLGAREHGNIERP